MSRVCAIGCSSKAVYVYTLALLHSLKHTLTRGPLPNARRRKAGEKGGTANDKGESATASTSSTSGGGDKGDKQGAQSGVVAEGVGATDDKSKKKEKEPEKKDGKEKEGEEKE